MYIYIYICISMCIYIYIYKCMCMCIYIYREREIYRERYITISAPVHVVTEEQVVGVWDLSQLLLVLLFVTLSMLLLLLLYYYSMLLLLLVLFYVTISISCITTSIIHSFMALPSAQERSEDGNESVSLERSETHPSDKLVLLLVLSILLLSLS